MARRMFNSKRRETIWLRARFDAAQASRGPLPICNICDLPVLETDDWDESHHLHKPRAFGGGDGVEHVGVAHHLCNLRHGAEVVTPAVAKSNRIRRKHIGAQKPGMGRHAMRGGRRAPFKIAIGGGTKPRLTNAERHRAFIERRYGCFTDHAEG